MKNKVKENLPLKNIKVLDASSFIAAPLTSAIMSDYGAEVIKIESPLGDSYRNACIGGQVWPESKLDWAFLLENRNKRSLSVDLKTDEGQIILKKLLKNTDVFITNLPKSPRKRLGLTSKIIRKINPKIIYTSLSGYGETGPQANSTALDATAWWASSGLMEWSKPINGEFPPFPVPGIGDHPTGLSLLSAILLALINREKTGMGTTVSTSLFANGIWANAMLVQAALAGHKPIDTFHWANLSALRNLYYLKDKSILFIMLTDENKYWLPFIKALRIEKINSDKKYNTQDKRQKNREGLKDILQKIFKKLTYKEVNKKLSPTGVIFSKIQTTQEAIKDPSVQANNMFLNIQQQGYKNLKTVAPPLNIEDVKRVPSKRAPKLGEHSKQILSEIGYSSMKIRQLKRKDVIS